MEHLLATMLAALLRDLRQQLESVGWPSPEAAFASYVLEPNLTRGVVASLSSLAWPDAERVDHAPALATVGYLLADRPQGEVRQRWLRGMERLIVREAFPSDRQSFAHRPVELLGLALGATACRDEAPRLCEWLRGVVQRAYKDHAGDTWSNGLELAAEVRLGIRSTLPAGPPEGAIATELALWRWLSLTIPGASATATLDKQLLTACLQNPVSVSSPAQSAVLYGQLIAVVDRAIESEIERSWQVGRPHRDGVLLVQQICRRFHLFAQQLLVRHGQRETLRMGDEHDVQDAMHALLKLHFHDVRPEEVAPSVGGKSSRMDFLLKQERVIVETKMTRRNLKQKEVSDELIIDMRRYRAHPECGTLVCFVYDPEGHCHAPAALEADLSGDQGGLQTVVIVCPAGL